MRLIDVKNMEKQIKEAFYENPFLIGMLLRWVRKQPTIDAVPVVRCSQCEKWQKKEETWLCKNFGYCTECMMDCPADHFCSYGERKDGEA